MKVIKLLVNFEAQRECKLPIYKSPMIRGSLGHSILESIEENKSNYWHIILKKLFKDFYKGERGNDCNKFNSVKTIPHPFSIYSEDKKTFFQQGDCFDFELTIYGYAIIHLPMILYSLERLAAKGLGRMKSNFKMVSAKVLTAEKKYIKVFQNSNVLQDRLNEEICFDIQPLDIDNINAVNTEAIIKLKSPTRWSQRVNNKTDFVFYDFFKAVMRRISILSYFWGDDEWADFNFRYILERVKNIEVSSINLNWVSYERFSTLQDKKISLSGWQGDINFTSIPVGIIDFLQQASSVYIGKSTVFGAGKYSVAKFG